MMSIAPKDSHPPGGTEPGASARAKKPRKRSRRQTDTRGETREFSVCGAPPTVDLLTTWKQSQVALPLLSNPNHQPQSAACGTRVQMPPPMPTVFPSSFSKPATAPSLTDSSLSLGISNVPGAMNTLHDDFSLLANNHEISEPETAIPDPWSIF
jgi:hypothetical protein